jgi:predicted HNH restriction endonuclease
MAQTLRSHVTPEAEMERYERAAGIVAGCVAILGAVYFVCLFLLASN